jgi:hypothetical protein
MTDKEFEMKLGYFSGAKDALGYDTVWSLYDFDCTDQTVFKDGAKQVCYTFYASDASVEELLNDTAEKIEVSATASSGSVRDLWAAAESCYQQAKQKGDWHKFIEDIQLRDDGSFELFMGS